LAAGLDGFDFLAALAGLSAAAGAVPPLIEARSASIRLQTLLGAGFFATAIGWPFCFFSSSSYNAAS
jgi:hypothetical protein